MGVATYYAIEGDLVLALSACEGACFSGYMNVAVHVISFSRKGHFFSFFSFFLYLIPEMFDY